MSLVFTECAAPPVAAPSKHESTMASSSPLQNPSKQWRYTWECLAHIPTLRLYLFPSAIVAASNPSLRCGSLSAAFRPELSLLVVRFSDAIANGTEVFLRVPVPRVLVDPVSPIECTAKDEHIEVKLMLLLPVDNPVVAELLGEVNDLEKSTPLSLNSDLKALSAGGVNFYCKTCSTKLTRKSLSHFVEMPSMNWQEAADNWFGACCCSFGGISEKLASQYVKSYACKEGTGLLDAASVTICKDDLEGYLFHGSVGSSDEKDNIYDFTATVKKNSNVDSGEDAPQASESSTNGSLNSKNKKYDHESCLCERDSLSYSVLPSRSCCGSHVDGMLTSWEGDSFQGGDTLRSLDLISLKFDRSTSFQDYEKAQADSCGFNGYSVDVTSISSFPNLRRILLRNNILGSSFMVRTSNLSKDIEWVDFKCKNCLSLLGAYPSFRNIYSSIDGGIRLFKCYISTSPLVGGSNDIFRRYTMQRLFVNLLLETAVDELSFRTIVRDMKTKDPMLQIVLLNSKAWCTTGYSFENCDTWNQSDAELLPIIKVLFSDNACWNGKPRVVEDCSATARNDVEDVYMMACQIKELVYHLNLARDLLPASCSSLESMSLSSLKR